MVYHQESGIFEITSDSSFLAYSGFGNGKNNPGIENVHNKGPLPKGYYDIAGPHDTQQHGPFVFTLTPHKENEMFGRAGFLIHGDSKKEPGDASHGCIVTNLLNRQSIWKSADRLLQVVG